MTERLRDVPDVSPTETVAAPRRPDKPRIVRRSQTEGGAAPRPRPEPEAPARRPAKPRPPLRPRSSDESVGDALTRLLGRERGARLTKRVDEAARAFSADRYQDSRRILRPIASEAPDAPDVRELLGLAYYRLGLWKQAIGELEAFRELTGSTEQHPVLADSYRALEQWDQVDELWEELRAVSPRPEIVIEGRIVAAGALADRGRIHDAIRELERGWKKVASPRPYHLRRAYALADLYERSGAPQRARELFAWVLGHDPAFADAAQRVSALS